MIRSNIVRSCVRMPWGGGDKGGVSHHLILVNENGYTRHKNACGLELNTFLIHCLRMKSVLNIQTYNKTIFGSVVLKKENNVITIRPCTVPAIVVPLSNFVRFYTNLRQHMYF